MKTVILGLVAATLMTTPAAATSWKVDLFDRLDNDSNETLTLEELRTAECKTDAKMFKYADKNHDLVLTQSEYFTNRDLLGRCK
jgi:hypothetical protein